MQAVGAPLPELYGVGDDTKAAPVFRARNLLVLILRAQVGDPLFQLFAPGDHLALARRARAELAADGTAMEVGVGLLRRDRLDPSLDANLALHLWPEEGQRRPGDIRQLVAFAAPIVGVEDEAALVRPFEQHHS